MWPTNKKNYGTWNRCLVVFCPGNFHVTNDRSCSILESPSHSVEFVICIHQNWDPYSLSQVMFPKYDCWNDWTWTILKLTTRIPNWINPIKVKRPKKLYITVFPSIVKVSALGIFFEPLHAVKRWGRRWWWRMMGWSLEHPEFQRAQNWSNKSTSRI